MNCSICLEDIEFSKKKTLLCEHMFHKDCISQCNDKCPICRKPLEYLNNVKEYEKDIYDLLECIHRTDDTYNEFINNYSFSNKFILKFHENIDLNRYFCETSDSMDLDDILEKFKYDLEWDDLSANMNFTTDQLYQFKEFINFPIYFINHMYLHHDDDFPLDLLYEIKDWDLDWNIVSSIMLFKDEELYRFRHYIVFNIYFQSPYVEFDQIPCDFLYEIKDEVDWFYIHKHKNMTNEQKAMISKYLEKK